ncbi:hypothetical protein TNCV_2502771 [Trichonephila clavipes]|nr:hypothetical protein TNCV_2502771 [Trichonephila clavipes]
MKNMIEYWVTNIESLRSPVLRTFSSVLSDRDMSIAIAFSRVRTGFERRVLVSHKICLLYPSLALRLPLMPHFYTAVSRESAIMAAVVTLRTAPNIVPLSTRILVGLETTQSVRCYCIILSRLTCDNVCSLGR